LRDIQVLISAACPKDKSKADTDRHAKHDFMVRNATLTNNGSPAIPNSLELDGICDFQS
jgi:hypothetical protein